MNADSQHIFWAPCAARSIQRIHARVYRTLVRLRWLWALCVGGAVLLGVCSAQAGPNDFRVKIDRIETKDAPTVKLFTTFLNDVDVPVNPRRIDQVRVFVGDRLLEEDTVEVGIWRDEPEGTDLVLILPATGRMNETAQKALGEASADVVAPLREEDRAGLVAYNFSTNINVPLTIDKSSIQEAYKKVERKGTRPFMFSALDKGLTMLEVSPEGRKRAIIFVGDGTDASAVQLEELNGKLRETIERARRLDVQIWTLGYGPRGVSKDGRRSLKLLSYKTRATFRQASGQKQLREALDATIGEIIGQLVLRVTWDFVENTEYDFRAELKAERSVPTRTDVFKSRVEEVKTDWVFWGALCGALCLLAGLGVFVLLISVRLWRRRRDRLEAEQLLAELLEERPEEDDDAREPLFVYTEEGLKLCSSCGRACQYAWEAYPFEEPPAAKNGVVCPFLQCPYDWEPPEEDWQKKKIEEAMLLGKPDPNSGKEALEEQAKATAAKQEASKKEAAAAIERQKKIAAGGRECNTCHRIMKPDWPECLYCASGLAPLPSKKKSP